MPDGGPLFRMHGLREILAIAPTGATIQHQIEALELAIGQGSAQALDMADGLVNSVCKTVLADRNHPCDSKWTTPQLFRETVTRLQLFPPGHPDPASAQDALTETIRGLSQAVQGLYNLRLKHGVIAHGRDSYSVGLQAAQITLAARAADAVSAFLLGVHRDYARVQPMTRIRYEDNGAFNNWVDSQYSVTVCEVPFVASEVLYNMDPDAYRDALLAYVPETDDADEASPDGGAP